MPLPSERRPTFINCAPKHFLSNSYDNTSDMTEFPPALGTVWIFLAASDSIILFTCLNWSNSVSTIPASRLLAISLFSLKYWCILTAKFSSMYMLKGDVGEGSLVGGTVFAVFRGKWTFTNAFLLQERLVRRGVRNHTCVHERARSSLMLTNRSLMALGT